MVKGECVTKEKGLADMVNGKDNINEEAAANADGDH